MRSKHDAKLTDKRTTNVTAQGAYRAPLKGVVKNTSWRGFDAKYDEAQQMQAVVGSTIVGTEGSRVDIKLVKAVAISSIQPQDIGEDNQRKQH